MTKIQLNLSMQLKFPLVCLLFVFIAINSSFSQSSASLNDKALNVINPSEFTIGHEDWTFYLDKESKVYYIDFESISVNLSDLKVLDEHGEVVMTDNLWDLPVNTIYELDMKGLNPGKYKIELRSYTGIIEKEVSVSE